MKHSSWVEKALKVSITWVLLLTGWQVSLMVDTVIIWDNKLNNNSIKKGMGFWIWEVAIANSILSILWVDYLFIEKVFKIVKNMIKKGY
jgi:hypothetical protein